jgi:hypothetical protein
VDPTVEEVTRKLYNRWRRILKNERGLMTFTGSNENDDSMELPFQFSSAQSAQFDGIISWERGINRTKDANGDYVHGGSCRKCAKESYG